MDIEQSILDNESLIAMFSKLSKELSSLMTDQLKVNKIDLTLKQAIVLYRLTLRDNIAQHDLALITERDKTSLTRLLLTMEKKALILREQSKIDRRIKVVSITKLGRNQFEKAKPIIKKIANQVEEGIDNSQLRLTKDTILKIYKNLNLQYEQ